MVLWLPLVWLQLSGTAPVPPLPPAHSPQRHPTLPWPHPWHCPPGTPSPPPSAASRHSPSVNLYFGWCSGHRRGHQPCAPPKHSTWGGPWQHPWPRTAVGAPGTPRAGGSHGHGPPGSIVGTASPPLCPWRLPQHLRGGLGTTRTLWRERGVSRDPRAGTSEWRSWSGGPRVGTLALGDPKTGHPRNWGPRHTWQPDPTEPQPRGSSCPKSLYPQPWGSPCSPALGGVPSPSPGGFHVPVPGVPAPPCPHPPEPGPATSSSPLPPPLPPRPTRPAASPAAARPGQLSLGGTGGSGPPEPPLPRLQAQPRGGGGLSAVSPQPPGHATRPVLTCGHEGVFGCPRSHPTPRGLGAGALRLLLLLLVELRGRGVTEEQRPHISAQNTPRGSQSPHIAARAPQHSRAPPYWHSEPPHVKLPPHGAAGWGPSAQDTPQPLKGWQKGEHGRPQLQCPIPDSPSGRGQERWAGVTQWGREYRAAWNGAGDEGRGTRDQGQAGLPGGEAQHPDSDTLVDMGTPGDSKGPVSWGCCGQGEPGNRR